MDDSGATTSSGKGPLARPLAWARAYLAAGDPEAAAVCFREVLDNRSSAGARDRDHRDALRLAEDLATTYLRRGRTDEAAEFMRLASAWARGELDPPAGRDPERTLLARRPRSRPASTSRARGIPPEDTLELTVEDLHDVELEVDDDLDAITAVFRPGPSWAAISIDSVATRVVPAKQLLTTSPRRRAAG